MLLKENKIDIFQEPKIVDSNDLLFTLFTSGSTGKPKGINHSVAGYLVYSKYSIDNFFNLDSESNILTATDAGWINGHTYALYGPLLANSKITLIEDLTKLSNPDFLYRVISTLKVTHFYASVTLLRLIKLNAKKSLNVSNLNRIGSCGEPLAHDVGKWALNYFNPKSKVIINTYFQTETGGVLTAPTSKYNNSNDLSNVGSPPPRLKY